MKVLVTDKLDPSALALLRDRGLEVEELVGADEGARRAAAGDAVGWIVRSGTRISAADLEAAPALKVVGRAGVGVDNVDVAAATRRGVAVLNTPSGNTIAAVEHTIAMLLAMSRHLPQAHASLVTERKWERSGFTGVELYGKSIGVLGLGKIGSRVATRCRAFEMNVLGYDPYLSPEQVRGLGVTPREDLDALLAECDFLTLHLPSTPETAGLLDAERLSRARRGVRIVNCARGQLVDEQALADALTTGQVAGAALDVFAEEPPFDSPLLDAPNLVATPHLGASTVESQRNVGLQIAEQVADALQHDVYREAVNIPVKDWATMEKIQPQLALVERLGAVAQQFVGGAVSGVEVEYQGGPFEEIPAMNGALLKGLLRPVVGDSVNAVNAPMLAADRGIALAHTERARSRDYQSLVRVRISAGGRERTLAATVFTDQQPRLVELDGYAVELFLEGVLLLFMNVDRPGVIGDVGTLLGRHDINIAHFSLGRKNVGGEALAVIVVDEPLPAAVLAELGRLRNMKWVTQVVLDG